MKLYGIPNCDTVAKARKYLSEKGQDFEFIDFRAEGISAEELQRAFDALGAAVFNTRSPSWRTEWTTPRMATSSKPAPQPDQ